MTISIIVPTHNRSSQLAPLIQSLENQTNPNFEVIILNDGSTDDTQSVLETLSTSCSLNLKTFNSANLGRSKARNQAVTHSSGELLIFFDDDVRPNPESVQEHLNIQLQHTNLIIAGGPYRYDVSKFKNRFNAFRKHMEDKWYASDTHSTLSNSLRINGGNFSISRKAFDLIGGFDERLTDKEDFKLAYDGFHYHNIPTYSAPKSWVYHDDFRDLVQYIQRAKETRREEQKLKLLDHTIENFDPKRFTITAPNTFKFLIAKWIFRNKTNLILIEKLLNLKTLPKTLAFKLYDICLTVNVQYLK